MLSDFTTGTLLLLAAGLTEPVVDITTGNDALASAGVCLASNTIKPSLGNWHHILGHIPNVVTSSVSLTLMVVTFGITWSNLGILVLRPK
ncbi:MAG: hypothetical protein UCK65_05250 [Thomasclavelia ramosa]|nr:hypothetical protein [Thomasclavelia ramosa]